jgi:hypothetical protein
MNDYSKYEFLNPTPLLNPNPLIGIEMFEGTL